MNKANYDNPLGDLVTIKQCSELLNLGNGTIRTIAKQAGAERRIGRSYRINRKILLDYIEKVYS